MLAREAHAMMIMMIMVMFGGKPNCVKCVLFLISLGEYTFANCNVAHHYVPDDVMTITNDVCAVGAISCAWMDERTFQHALLHLRHFSSTSAARALLERNSILAAPHMQIYKYTHLTAN